MVKQPKVHLPSAPDYDPPGFEPLHRGPLREGVARLYADAGSIPTPMYEADGVTPVLKADGSPKWHVNPSVVGVTWAWVLVGADGVEGARASGSLLCPIIRDGRTYPAQCDISEWYAVMHGLHHVPPDLGVLEVATDNLLTIHRMFHQYPCRTLPPSWVQAAAIRRRVLMRNGLALRPIHLKGHPTREWLAQGHTGDAERPGFPVSPYNALVDKLCSQEAKKVMEARRANDQGQAQEQGQEQAAAGEARAAAAREQLAAAG